MKKIISIVSLIILLSFAGFANAEYMRGKISGVVHYEIIPQNDSSFLVKTSYDQYVNLAGIEVNGAMDMIFSVCAGDDTIYIKMVMPYWADDHTVVGVLSVILAEGQGLNSIIHLEALEGPDNMQICPTQFAIYLNSCVIGAYGYWLYDWVGPFGETLKSDAVLTNAELIFRLLF